MAQTNFWQQIWQREKPWNTGDVVGTALQVPGEALDSLDRAVRIPGTKWSVYDARHAVIDPAVKQTSKLHPAAGVATNIAAEILIPDSTFYFGKLVKGVSKASKALRGAELAFETAGAVSKTGKASDVSRSSNVLQSTSNVLTEIPKNPSTAKNLLRGKERFGKKVFKEFETKTNNALEYAANNNYALSGIDEGARTITFKGETYKLESSSRTGSGRFSWKHQARTGKELRDATRGLDDATLVKHLKTEGAAAYKATNSLVNKKLREAIKAHNKTKKGKLNPLTVEHIFDVQHYGRLGKQIERFSGKGADELGNLRVLGLSENARTGAIARKLDSGDELIKAIRNDTFVDYNKVIPDYKNLGLSEQVNSFSAKKWKDFTDYAIANPEVNIHDLLVDFVSPKK